MLGRDFRGGKYRFGFTGLECDNEFGNTYHTENREFNTKNAVWFSIDPLFRNFPSFSPYNYTEGNPILFNDRKGKSKESTHTDKDGNVLAVYNDGDNSVYKHTNISIDNFNNKKPLDKMGKGIFNMGETLYWDEFIVPENGKAEGKINFEKSWDNLIVELHAKAVTEYDLVEIGNLSKNGKDFDIKANKKYAPDGPMSGALLDGKWATARSAGNDLAGWNGRTGSYCGLYLSQYGYMNLAGSLQQKKYKGKATAFDIIFQGVTFGPPPYYGEMAYSGRMIINGWDRSR
jgi:RHS repeat-associated protein